MIFSKLVKLKLRNFIVHELLANLRTVQNQTYDYNILDQSVYAWGSNKYCELGVNTAEIFVEHPVYVKSLEFINITKYV